MRRLLTILFIVLVPLRATGQEQVLYRTDAYTLTTGRVRQGQFEALARSRNEIESNYRSRYDTSVQVKFLVNGTLKEMADYEENKLFFSSDDERVTSPVYLFGTRESSDFIGRGEGANADSTTAVRFRLDMRPMLEAFREKGFYEFYNLKRITPAEFKGVYITGDLPPLVKQLDEAAPLPSQFQLTDPEGDGIYEIEVQLETARTPAKNATAAASWKLQTDISRLPQYQSSQLLMNALYDMSLEEMLLNVRPDGAFRAGKLWDGVWTRDISYSILLALATVAPGVARESLMKKVSTDGRIIQDTGTGGSWPVSTDRMVWALAAWEVYAVTGEREWLREAYRIISKSARADLKVVRAPNGLFYGESSFMDWREQSYPRWMGPTDIYQSQCLSTNAVHYETLRILARMARLLGERATEYEEEAAALKAAINRHLWMADRGFYGAYRYGRTFSSLSPRSESLGEALSILFDIADESQRVLIVRNAPVVDFGVPDFFPQIPNMPAYHNNAVWPFVVGYWTWAAAKARNATAVEHGLGAIYRQAALFLTNKENMTATGGDPTTMLNSDRQLWSVAANLALVYRIFFGMQFEADRLLLKPFIPRAYRDRRTLANFKYRDATLDITIDGYGDQIKSVMLDGVRQPSAVVPGNLKGKHQLVITMANNNLTSGKLTKLDARFSPETPRLSLSGSRLAWNAVAGAQKYFVFRNGVKISETTRKTFRLPRSVYAEYQVLAVDGRGSQSFLSAPVEVLSSAGKIEIEAEEGREARRNQYEGYSGSGYLRLERTENRVLDYRVKVARAGRYAIRFRYANGNGPVNTENKCAVRTLSLDGKHVGALVMPQRGTEWNNWGYSNLHTVNLTAGRHLLRIAFEDSDENMNGAVNEALLDKIELTLIGR